MWNENPIKKSPSNCLAWNSCLLNITYYQRCCYWTEHDYTCKERIMNMYIFLTCSLSLSTIFYLYACMCVFTCSCVCTCIWACRIQKMVLRSTATEVTGTCESHPTWVLGTELKSSARAITDLKCCIIFTQPVRISLEMKTTALR